MKKPPPTPDQIRDLHTKERYSLFLNKKNVEELLAKSSPDAKLSHIVDVLILDYLEYLRTSDTSIKE